MGNLKGKKVLIFQQRGWGVSIGHFLAKKLQTEGCKLAALTFKKTAHEFLLNQKEVKYNLVINNDEVISDSKSYLSNDDYSLKEICENLDLDSIWPIIMTLRTHVKSYEDKYYYSFKQYKDDDVIIDYVKAAYKVIKKVFKEFNPEIIVAPNFASLIHIMFNLYARKRGVKMMAITDCKIKDICMFSYDYNNIYNPFCERVDELNSKKAETENKEKAKKYIRGFRQAFKQPSYSEKYNVLKKKSLKERIRNELSPYNHILKWYFSKKINVLGKNWITVDYRPPRIIFRDHYASKRNKKYLDKLNYYPFKKIKKFVYFPLQAQPELTIDVIAPFFSNQIEVARQLAMSMPDDYSLVVKEHPKMIGLRPPSYIEKIIRTPNVKFVDYRISNEEILKKSDLIACPNSTTLAEAAFYNKPAIQLGNLGTTLKLPNVFKHTDMTTLSAKIKELLKIDLNTEDYERRLENYVAAAYDVGFEFNYWGVWDRDEKGDMGFLWQMYKNEIEKNLAN